MGDWNGREWNVGFDGRVRRFYRHWVGYYGLFQVLWLKNSDEDEDCTVLLEMGEKKRFLLETKASTPVASGSVFFASCTRDSSSRESSVQACDEARESGD